MEHDSFGSIHTDSQRPVSHYSVLGIEDHSFILPAWIRPLHAAPRERAVRVCTSGRSQTFHTGRLDADRKGDLHVLSMSIGPRDWGRGVRCGGGPEVEID